MMRAPDRPSLARAYLAGVVVGDGWLTETEIGLRVKDRDFADAFSAALERAFGVLIPPRCERRTYGSYWVVRSGNRTGRFHGLRDLVPANHDQRAAWLRGLFDSEGNAQLTMQKHRGPGCYGRRVAIYSTTIETLRIAAARLAHLGINTGMRTTKHSKGHKGTKTVYELFIRPGKNNYALFATMVGSSILRKQTRLDAIVASYKADLSAHCREIQRRGAATKLRRTLTELVPAVICKIAARIAIGAPVTQRACAMHVAGYHSARNHMKHRELVEAARSACHS